jgi:L-ascorbate metabolism protein UlaG (beta-lactamase superfamily)
MKIHKIGHCCLVIEDQGVKVLTDPGNFSTGQDDVDGVDAVLVTHEHADHFHIDSVKRILDRNPGAPVVTNAAVAKLLSEAGVPYTLLEDGGTIRIGDLTIEAFETQHAEIYPGIPRVLNTAFCIGDRLFYPGDAFLVPLLPIEILALPVVAPWMKTSDCIDYARKVKPRVCFPVHDAIVSAYPLYHGLPKRLLEQHGIDFVPMLPGDDAEF